MLIQKCGYIKPKGAARYLRYIATREGVELRPRAGPATEKQEKLIGQVLKDYPDSVDLFEYADYLAAPSAATAAAFLTMALDAHAAPDAGASGYMRYISFRPGAERRGAHGLFSAANDVDLDAVGQEVSEHSGPVWTVIWSLRREDAARLGYDSSEAWRGLLLSRQSDMAKAFGLDQKDLRWYAAYHDADSHPHVHVMLWSAASKKGFLSHDGVELLRSKLTNAIYQRELVPLYQEKSGQRDALVRQAKEAVTQLSEALTDYLADAPETAEKLLALASALEGVSGKMQYGYLPRDLKAQVDEVVDALEKMPEVAACYEAWNVLRDRLEGYYKNTPRQRLPLSQQKEFRSIKNAVIREAVLLQSIVPTYEDAEMEDEPDTMLGETVEMEPEQSAEDTDEHEQKERYHSARYVLRQTDTPPAQRQAALVELERLWDGGSDVAAYLLGKCWRDGAGVPQDTALALQWFRRSAEAGNVYAACALGRLQLEQGNAEEGIRWLRRAAALGNSNAQYQMGKLYMAGEHLPKDAIQAIRYWKDAAAQGNQYAQYALGKLYLTGREIPRDKEQAELYLEQAAQQGNPYAQFTLERIDHCPDPAVLLSLSRLLYHMGRIFDGKSPPQAQAFSGHIDAKRRRQLFEKRLAMGHKADDHEEQRGEMGLSMG